MFWPFNIPAKRRQREAQRQREADARLQRIKDDIEAENRRQRARHAQPAASSYRATPTTPRSAPANALPSSSRSVYDDPMSPLNPLSPLHSINQASTFGHSVPESAHSSNHCHGRESGHSHDHGSSSSYSSDYSSSSSSSSYDSGSTSSSSDW